MLDTPQIVQTGEQLTACIHQVVPRHEIRNEMGPGIREVMAALAAQNISPSGPWFTHHLRNPTDVFDFEICMPVATTVTAAGRVKPGRLPAATVARTVYRGPYENLGSAWGEFEKWIADNGYVSATELWEIYSRGPESGTDSSAWETELNRPVAKAR